MALEAAFVSPHITFSARSWELKLCPKDGYITPPPGLAMTEPDMNILVRTMLVFVSNLLLVSGQASQL